ncbi:DUF308 domain-containing protein [Nocardia sp. NPDC059239]|uniref:DUF308 domain-containing protein n=1 Tax=Nocardia sp. NPDC059239 TaxID=3346785 RepID=UPI00367832C4
MIDYTRPNWPPSQRNSAAPPRSHSPTSAKGGIVLIVSPFASITALALVTGWWLIVLGVMEAIHAVQMRRATN